MSIQKFLKNVNDIIYFKEHSIQSFKSFFIELYLDLY